MARAFGAFLFFQVCLFAGPQFLTSQLLPAGQVGNNYSLQFAVVGASPGVTQPNWTLLAGSLPNGLSLSPSGSLSGTPFAAGSYAFEVEYSDGFDPAIVGYFSLAINGKLYVDGLPSKVSAVGLAESQAGITITGGNAPYQFAIQSGQLPPGLQLSQDGFWYGQHTVAGNFSYTILITDGTGNQLIVPVNQLVEATALTVLTNVNPLLRAGVPYRLPYEVTGGTPPYQFAGQQLPCGLTIDAQSGIISGTSCGDPEFNYYANIAVTDSLGLSVRRDVSFLEYHVVPAKIDGSNIYVMNQSMFWVFLPVPSGQPPFVWSGQVPNGLTFDADSGVIRGGVNQTGTIPISVTVTDGAGTRQTTQYTLNVAANPIQILTETLPGAVVGQPYSVQVKGSTTGQWMVASTDDSPFASQSIDANGVLSGTIKTGIVPRDYMVSFNLIGENGAQATRTFALRVASSNWPGERDYSVNWYGAVGQPFRQRLSPIAGKLPDTFSLLGPALPPGLALDSSGLLQGTPTIWGNFSFVVSATNSDGVTGAISVQMSFDGPSVSMGNGQVCPPGAWAGVPYTASIFAPPIYPGSATVKVTQGLLPPGLSLDPSTGILEGVPGAVGNFQFVTTGVYSSGVQTRSCQLVVGPNPSVQALTLPSVLAGASYTQTLPAITSGPITWIIGPGSLPPGLTLNPQTGVLTGSVANSGAYVFDAVASSGEQRTTAVFLLNVTSPSGLTISPTQLPVYAWGPSGTPPVFLSASGGVPPYQFDVAGGSLSGLQLDPVTGVLSGFPQQNGSVTIQVADSQGRKTTVVYQIMTAAGSALTLSIPHVSVLPAAVSGMLYTYQVSATGGVPPYQWHLSAYSGPSQDNIFFISSSGQINGIPLSAGNVGMTISVLDASGRLSTALVTLPVNDPLSGSLSIPAKGLPLGRPMFVYEVALPVAGGSPPYQWSISSGSLPPGLALSAPGLISGTPIAQGIFSFTAQAKDSTGASVTQAFSIAVNNTAPVIADNGIVNAASYQTGAIAPGEIVDIFGAGLGPQAIAYNSPGSTGFGTQAAQTQVFFDGIPAPIIFVSDKQTAAVVPFRLAGRSYTTVTIANDGLVSAPVVMPVADYAPAIFTADASGTGVGAIINQDGTRNSQQHPAPRSSIVTLFATGTGILSADMQEGQLSQLQPPFPSPLVPVTLSMGQAAANIVYQGVAPGEIAGLTQINVVVPANAVSGTVPIVIRQATVNFLNSYAYYFGNYLSSQDGVVIYIQ